MTGDSHYVVSAGSTQINKSNTKAKPHVRKTRVCNRVTYEKALDSFTNPSSEKSKYIGYFF
ncbi:MAG: hypothetical protein PV340_01520 [Wolbachia sp.]|nr:hypothetical protein [Wolbachia sp.]